MRCGFTGRFASTTGCCMPWRAQTHRAAAVWRSVDSLRGTACSSRQPRKRASSGSGPVVERGARMIWSDIATAAATLFFVMDPLGNIAVFNGVLSRFSPRRRAQITARELVIALAIMLVLLFAGTRILNFLGLTQPSLNIAGGVLLFIIALRMIFPGGGEVATVKDEPFIVPLAMPMVAGPST